MQNSLDSLINQLTSLKAQRVATFGVYSPSIKRLKSISENGTQILGLAPSNAMDQTHRVTQHSSVNEAEALMADHGEILKMKADGNCGYHAAKYIFHRMDLIPRISMTGFRKRVAKYGERHMNKFVGIDPETGEDVEDYGYRNNVGDNAYNVCNVRKSTRRSAEGEPASFLLIANYYPLQWLQKCTS